VAEAYPNFTFCAKNERTISIKVTNSGNQPIKSDDYERSLTMSVDAPARILTAQVIETNPSNLLPELLPDGSGGWQSQLPAELALDTDLRVIQLKPTLLNPGDSFKAKMLVSEFTRSHFHLDGRIVGVKDIEEVKERQITRSLAWWAGILLMTVFVFFGETWGESEQPAKRYLAVFVLVALMMDVVVLTWGDVRRTWKALQDKD
jgi:hypothetical protein